MPQDPNLYRQFAFDCFMGQVAKIKRVSLHSFHLLFHTTVLDDRGEVRGLARTYMRLLRFSQGRTRVCTLRFPVASDQPLFIRLYASSLHQPRCPSSSPRTSILIRHSATCFCCKLLYSHLSYLSASMLTTYLWCIANYCGHMQIQMWDVNARR